MRIVGCDTVRLFWHTRPYLKSCFFSWTAAFNPVAFVSWSLVSKCWTGQASSHRPFFSNPSCSLANIKRPVRSDFFLLNEILAALWEDNWGQTSEAPADIWTFLGSVKHTFQRVSLWTPPRHWIYWVIPQPSGASILNITRTHDIWPLLVEFCMFW